MRKTTLLATILVASMCATAQTQVKVGDNLQTAIDTAKSGTTLYVQAGTFKGNFTMKDGVNVSGGWDATFTTQTEYGTILDANASGRVVHQPSAFTTLTIWSNLTIQNGNLKEKASDQLGSGVALNKNGRVEYCLIQNNTYSYTSGNCLGGGVGQEAGAAQTDVLVDHCVIRNNKASHGGGVRIRGTIQNSIIENNLTEANAAGGLHLQAGIGINCIIRNNKGKATGGVRLYNKCKLIGCLVANNTSVSNVGGISIEGANSDVIGCTVVGNKQKDDSYSKCGISCAATADNGTYLANNIVWGNMNADSVPAAQIYYVSHYSAAHRIYNAVNKQTTNNNGTCFNLNPDNDAADGPRFVDPANGDYRLRWDSPLLNRGSDTLATKYGVAADLLGVARPAGDAVDYGCYEHPYVTLTVAELSHSSLQAGEQSWTAGDYSLPAGFTTDMTIQAEENYCIEKVMLGETLLTPNDGSTNLYTLTVDEDCTLAITTKSSDIGSVVANVQDETEEVIAIFDMTGKRVDMPTQAGIYILHTSRGAKKVELK